MRKELYLEKTIGLIPRLLSCLDKNPVSKTFGCFDRSYWHYKTSDFACARMQEAVLTLSLLYKLKHNLNWYYKNKTLLFWIESGIKFWESIQNKNNSFNEWYAGENSFCATAFTAYAISEALLLLKEDMLIHKYQDSLAKAGDWLLTKHEEGAQNQEAGAAIALFNIYLLTNNNKYKLDAQKRVDSLIKNQTKEGWFFEYGGFDVGYSSLMIYCLANYYYKTRDAYLLHSLKKATKFLKEFIDTSITPGGCYGSRNTEFLIPSGFEILSKVDDSSLQLASCIRQYLAEDKLVFPCSTDDRYMLCWLYTLLQSYLYAQDKRVKYSPKNNFSSKQFESAKIWTKNTPYFKMIMNYGKGGAFKLSFKKTGKILNDCGIYVEKDKQQLFSGWLNSSYIKNNNQNSIEIYGNLGFFSQELMSPFKSILKNSFSLAPLNNLLASEVKKALRKKLIGPPKKTEIRYSRKIFFEEDKLKIEDSIPDISGFKKIATGFGASNIYVPTSDYSNKERLDFNPIIFKDVFNFKLRRVYNKNGDLLICEFE